MFLVRHLQRELQPQHLISNVISGLLCGVLDITLAVSLGVLIFSGEPHYQSVGIGMGLFSNLVTGLGIGLASSYAPVMAGVNDTPAIILTTVVASMAATMAIEGTQDRLPTLLTAIALIVILTGVIAWVLGQLRLSNLVRFIPYPVVGGFLAGSGLLLVQGGLSVILDIPQSTLFALIQPHLVWHWLSGVVFAITLVVPTRRYSHWLIFPGCILMVISLFFIGFRLTGTSLEMATEQGWLIHPLPQGGVWQPINLLNAAPHVNWSVILQHLPSALPVMLLSIIGLLLNSSGLEIAVRSEVNLDRELKAFGFSNVVSGLGGGLIGYHIVSNTLLANKLGAKGRTACVIAAILSGIALFIGSSFITLLPKPVVGGILIFAGIELLIEWIYGAWFRFSRLEYATIPLMLVIIVLWGFIAGIGVGVVIACVLFTFSYSRHQVIRHAFSGATHQSSVRRSFPQQQFLQQKGNQTYVLLLQGYIFFGNSSALLEKCATRLEDIDLPPPQFLVLDFRLVIGLDSSVVLSFIKMRQLAQKHGLRLVFTHLQPSSLQQLQEGGCILANDDLIQIFPELDRGIEWCEDQILETLPLRCCHSLALAYLEKIQAYANHILLRQGHSDTLHFVETGQAIIFLQLNSVRTRRLQILGAGTVVGEAAFYLSELHDTLVVTDQPSKFYCLTTASLQIMRRKNPKIAAALQKFISRLLDIPETCFYFFHKDYLLILTLSKILSE